MTTQARVVAILGPERARVLAIRRAACSNDCSACGVCEYQSMSVVAINQVGAQVGETVDLTTSTKTVLSAAFMVYIFPIILFFDGYFFFSEVHELGRALIGGGFAVLGVIWALLYNRWCAKSGAGMPVITKLSLF